MFYAFRARRHIVVFPASFVDACLFMLSVASETVICAHVLQSYRIYVQPQVLPLCGNCVPLSLDQPPTEMPRVCCPRGDAEVRQAPLGRFLAELSLRRHPRYKRQSSVRLLPPGLPMPSRADASPTHCAVPCSFGIPSFAAARNDYPQAWNRCLPFCFRAVLAAARAHAMRESATMI